MPKFDDRNEHDLWLSQAHVLLEAVIRLLDALFFILNYIYGDEKFPYKQVEVAPQGFLRPKGKKPSFHPKGQALDVRTKGMDRKLKKLVLAVLCFLKKFRNGQIQHVFEPYEEKTVIIDGKEVKQIRGEHIHIEIDTGDPV